MRKDAMWQKALGAVTLKDLAEWRHLAIELVQRYAEQTLPPKDWIIFAKEHRVDTFVDLLLGEKPRIYLSYHITGHEEFTDVQRFMKKLSDFFICIDPYTIKDWDVVKAYDDALRQMNKDSIDIEIKYSDYCHKFSDIPLKEIEEAIDLIRTQIVERDFQLIANVHATVVYHRDEKPSYGVMAEIIHSLRVDRPVYVLYPFKTRPSPFFEHFIKKENMIHGDKSIEELEEEMISKLRRDYKDWPTYKAANCD